MKCLPDFTPIIIEFHPKGKSKSSRSAGSRVWRWKLVSRDFSLICKYRISFRAKNHHNYVYCLLYFLVVNNIFNQKLTRKIILQVNFQYSLLSMSLAVIFIVPPEAVRVVMPLVADLFNGRLVFKVKATPSLQLPESWTLPEVILIFHGGPQWKQWGSTLDFGWLDPSGGTSTSTIIASCTASVEARGCMIRRGDPVVAQFPTPSTFILQFKHKLSCLPIGWYLIIY